MYVWYVVAIKMAAFFVFLRNLLVSIGNSKILTTRSLGLPSRHEFVNNANYDVLILHRKVP